MYSARNGRMPVVTTNQFIRSKLQDKVIVNKSWFKVTVNQLITGYNPDISPTGNL